MADAGTHRIKIANLCRFCGKTASSKKTFARPKEKLSLNSNDKVSMLKTTTTLFIPLISVCLTCDVRKDNRAQISILTSVCHAEVGTSSTVLQRDEKLAPSKWLKRLEEAKIDSSKKQCLINDCSAKTDDALLLRKELRNWLLSLIGMCDPKEDAAVSWKNYDFKEEVLAWANQASKRGIVEQAASPASKKMKPE